MWEGQLPSCVDNLAYRVAAGIWLKNFIFVVTIAALVIKQIFSGGLLHFISI